MIYITNEARSAELVMIISYPASPSRIIVLLKTQHHNSFMLNLFGHFFSEPQNCVFAAVFSDHIW